MKSGVIRYLLMLFILCHAQSASAHFFGATYSLPIPFSLYAYGASAALIVSFVLVGFFGNAEPGGRNFRTRDFSNSRIFSKLTRPEVVNTLRFLSVFVLML